MTFPLVLIMDELNSNVPANPVSAADVGAGQVGITVFGAAAKELYRSGADEQGVFLPCSGPRFRGSDLIQPKQASRSCGPLSRTFMNNSGNSTARAPRVGAPDHAIGDCQQFRLRAGVCGAPVVGWRPVRSPAAAHNNTQ